MKVAGKKMVVSKPISFIVSLSSFAAAAIFRLEKLSLCAMTEYIC